jgi:hypothetical protein
VPPFVGRQTDDDPPDPGRTKQTNPNEGPAERTGPSDSEGRIPLKVRGQTFEVTRDELVRYAELDPDEDTTQFSDAQLVRLAQKHIAANQSLEQAKELRRKTQEWSNNVSAGPPTQGQQDHDQGQPRPADPDSQPQETDDERIRRLHKEYVEEVRYGESEEEALAKHDAWQDAVRQKEQRTLQEQQAQQQAQQQLASTFEQIAAANADLFADDIASDVFQTVALRTAVEEIQKVLPVEQRQVFADRIYSAPDPAAAAGFVANNLRSMGYQLPGADQVMTRAVQAVRSRLNMPASAQPTSPSPQQQPQVPSDRFARKQALAPSPRPGAPIPLSPNAARNREQDPAVMSSAIEKIARARGQRIG